MARKPAETLCLFRDVAVTTRRLTDAQFGALMRAIFAYRFGGEEYGGDDAFVGLAFDNVKEQVIRFEENREQNRKNRTFRNWEENHTESHGIKQNASNVKEKQENDPPCPYPSPYPYPGPDNINNTAVDSPNFTRHKYGKYKNVLLSDVEMEKLMQEFPADWETRIELLSEYMASSGKNYKSHLATIRSWARKEKNGGNELSRNGATAERFGRIGTRV